VAQRLDPVCDRFESAWLANGRPRLEDFLLQVGEPERAALLRELLALDLDYRARLGERPTAQEYRTRLPEHTELIDAVFAALPAPAKGPTPLPSTAERQPAPVQAGGEATLLRAGRYEIEGEIARGGMGAVWRARDPELRRTLAIKVMHEDFLARPHFPELERRFREEAQITGQLQHPGVPPVHEIGALPDGRPFFAMKLIQGRTLADLLEARTSPADDLPRFVGIFAQVCQTVAFAHSRGVIHRDLKPLNIMVGGFGEVQVMDWGLAKVLSPHPPAPSPKTGEGEQDRRQGRETPLPPTDATPAPPLPAWERGLGG
jgi:hypothetical protein